MKINPVIATGIVTIACAWLGWVSIELVQVKTSLARVEEHLGMKQDAKATPAITTLSAIP